MDNIDKIIREALLAKKRIAHEEVCDDIAPEQYDAYWSGYLSGHDKDVFYRHILSCEQCLRLFIETGALMAIPQDAVKLSEPPIEIIEAARRLIHHNISPKRENVFHKLLYFLRIIRFPSYAPLVPDSLRGGDAEIKVDEKIESYSISKKVKKLDILFSLIEREGHWSIEVKVDGVSKDEKARVIIKRGRKELFSSSLGGSTALFQYIPPAKYKLLIRVNKSVRARLSLNLKEKRYG